MATIRVCFCKAAEVNPGWSGTWPVAVADGETYSRPDVAAGQDGLVVAAWNAEELSHDIYTASSHDYGATWSEPAVISTTESDSYYPDVLIVGEQVFVSWTEEDANHRRVQYEAEYGLDHTWSVRQVPGSESGGGSRGRLAANESNLFLVFNAGTETNRDILYASRALTGTVWTTATAAYTHTGTADEREPVVALSADGGTIHLAWEEVDSALYQVIYMSGTVTGGDITWHQPVGEPLVSANSSVRPSISVGRNGNVHTAWGERGEGDVFSIEYSRYDVDAGAWLTPTVTVDTNVEVNAPSPGHPNPLVASYGSEERNDVCVVWNGFRTDENAEEVWIRCSADGGDAWTEVQNVSRTPEPVQMSIWPAMGYGNDGGLYLVWRESAAFDSYQIYYSRSLDYQAFLPLVTRLCTF